ncbi:MAG: hypothetical protein ABFS32_17025 [Bacteroidota bacterium]
MKKLAVLLLLVFISSVLLAQTARLLPKNVNHPGYNNVYPAVSGDGKVIIFMSDYSDDGSFVLRETRYYGGKWQDPTDLDVVGSSIVNNWGGYSINYDGTAIYFSSRRSEGIGKFDIWYTTLKDGQWARPKNVGKPVNSPENEGNPSISPDNQRMYFMRCNSMSNSNMSGCKLYYSQRGVRGWQEAVELPAHINNGNTTSPRILPDNRTLVFTSDRPGGKGGLDIWMSKRTGDHWSEPVNIKPVNTSSDDYFLSASIRSVAFYTTTTDKGKKAIVEQRLSEPYKIEDVIVSQGSVKDDEGNTLAANVRAYNLKEKAYEVSMRTSIADGNFIIILPEGAEYDVSYSDVRLEKLYRSELVDAKELVAPRRQYPNIILKNLVVGITFPLNVFGFKPYTSEIDEFSTQELNRLTKLLKRYPDLNIEIGTYQKTYTEDSLQSQDDLTELRRDNIIVYEPAIRADAMENQQKDSLLIAINNELATIWDDTTVANVILERLAAVDSIQVEQELITYHNDRSIAQAEAVKTYLTVEGISENRIQTMGYRDGMPPVPFLGNKDRMVVIKFLNNPTN